MSGQRNGTGRACHCLCFINHPEDLDVCEATRHTSVEFELDGKQIEVPMCSRCAVAVEAAQAA